MSRDDLESVLPKPDFSWDDRDFSEELFFFKVQPSWFGGASFLMFTTLSTILVPITTGLTSSLQVESALLMATTRIPLTYAIPFETRPLEDDRALGVGATGLPLEAETCLSGNDVFKFVAPDFVTLFFNVGVVDLDVGLEAASAGTEGLAVGVDERAIGLVGVEDLTTGLMKGCVVREVGVEALGFAVVGNVALEVGVEALEGFVLAGNVDRPVGVADLQGVADLEAADFSPPVEDGRLFAAMEAFEPVDKPA